VIDPTLDQRRYLCGAAVTLDGTRARITGAHNRFATVAAWPDGVRRCEFAWATVARIVARGGAFKS
jgi:hypothetical protein